MSEGPYRWRIVQSKWGLRAAPWTGSVGIEVDDDSTEAPSLVCWVYRGWPSSVPALIAAAPAMAEALSRFVREIDHAVLVERDLPMSPLADALRDALAALALARGEP